MNSKLPIFYFLFMFTILLLSVFTNSSAHELPAQQVVIRANKEGNINMELTVAKSSLSEASKVPENELNLTNPLVNQYLNKNIQFKIPNIDKLIFEITDVKTKSEKLPPFNIDYEIQTWSLLFKPDKKVEIKDFDLSYTVILDQFPDQKAIISTHTPASTEEQNIVKINTVELDKNTNKINPISIKYTSYDLILDYFSIFKLGALHFLFGLDHVLM